MSKIFLQEFNTITWAIDSYHHAVDSNTKQNKMKPNMIIVSYDQSFCFSLQVSHLTPPTDFTHFTKYKPNKCLMQWDHATILINNIYQVMHFISYIEVKLSMWLGVYYRSSLSIYESTNYKLFFYHTWTPQALKKKIL